MLLKWMFRIRCGTNWELVLLTGTRSTKLEAKCRMASQLSRPMLPDESSTNTKSISV